MEAGDVIFLALFLYAGIFAGLTFWLAEQKNRPVGVWALLGALLGPWALLTVGMAPALDPDDAAASKTSDEKPDNRTKVGISLRE